MACRIRATSYSERPHGCSPTRLRAQAVSGIGSVGNLSRQWHGRLVTYNDDGGSGLNELHLSELLH